MVQLQETGTDQKVYLLWSRQIVGKDGKSYAKAVLTEKGKEKPEWKALDKVPDTTFDGKLQAIRPARLVKAGSITKDKFPSYPYIQSVRSEEDKKAIEIADEAREKEATEIKTAKQELKIGKKVVGAIQDKVSAKMRAKIEAAKAAMAAANDTNVYEILGISKPVKKAKKADAIK